MSKKDEAIELADVLDRTHPHLREVTTLLRQWPEQPEAKPAGWKCAACGDVSECQGAAPNDNWCSYCGVCGEMRPLYAAPLATTAQPLTDEQIAAACRPLYSSYDAAVMGLADDIATARAIEAAHGVGGTKP